MRRKSTLPVSLFYLSVSKSHGSETVSQHAPYQDPETKAAKWNPAIVNSIIHICAFPFVTCQNVFCVKDLNIFTKSCRIWFLNNCDQYMYWVAHFVVREWTFQLLCFTVLFYTDTHFRHIFFTSVLQYSCSIGILLDT